MPQIVLSDATGTGMKTAVARPRSMAPKEHGAWGQVVIPLVVALGLGQPGSVAWGLALAVVALFIAHEPLTVLLGQRGTRAAREVGQSARRRLLLLIGAATLLGGVAVTGGSSDVRLAVLASLGLLLVAIFGFLVKGRERSTFGELWIAWTLPFAAVPVALASEVSLRITLVVWLSFALAFCTGIFGVRAIIRDYREGRKSAGWLGLGVTLALIVLLVIQSKQAAVAALLFWLVVASCRALRPTPKSLRRVGWLLVGASVVQAVWLLVALRAWG